MSTRDLARFFLRLQALAFVVYALYDLSDFGSVYRDFKTVHEFREMDSLAAERFWSLMSRVSLQIAIAVLFLGMPEKIIDWLTSGKWPKATQKSASNVAQEPNQQSSETTRGK